MKIKQEIQKLLDVGYKAYLAPDLASQHCVCQEKKNGQIRCCIDFRNLNKACPQEELPNIDMIVDAVARHSMSLDIRCCPLCIDLVATTRLNAIRS